MLCIKFKSPNVFIIETRQADNAVYRRRRCSECNTQFCTSEKFDDMAKTMIYKIQNEVKRQSKNMRSKR